MRATHARPGALCVDSLQFSEAGTLAQAQALRADGIEAVYVYLGVINVERLGYILQAGMAAMPVTLAGHFDGAAAVAQLNALGIPLGTSVCLDLEGLPIYNQGAAVAIQKVNAWADPVSLANFDPALYVGVPQPLSAEQLWDLRVRGYWRGQGAAVEPARCGWWAYQAWPSVTRGGVLVDVDMLTQDYLGRIPTWVIAS
jgi:hypothetical protein